MPDIVIIGGAANGWATAHHLKRLDPSISVTVVERDPTLRFSSTMLSDGNVRIQFNVDENILISKFAMECLEDFAEAMAVGDLTDGAICSPVNSTDLPSCWSSGMSSTVRSGASRRDRRVCRYRPGLLRLGDR